jgi:hypothetical protein
MNGIIHFCKWCKQKILTSQTYITLPNQEISCLKCYKQSGHMLPFENKKNNFFNN